MGAAALTGPFSVVHLSSSVVCTWVRPSSCGFFHSVEWAECLHSFPFVYRHCRVWVSLPFQKVPEAGLSLPPSQPYWDFTGAEFWGLRRRETGRASLLAPIALASPLPQGNLPRAMSHSFEGGCKYWGKMRGGFLSLKLGSGVLDTNYWPVCLKEERRAQKVVEWVQRGTGGPGLWGQFWASGHPPPLERWFHLGDTVPS